MPRPWSRRVSCRRSDEQQLDKVRASYSYLRPPMHAVLDTVVLRGATSADDELLATLKRLRDARERFVDEPVALLPKTWQAWVLDDGRVQRTRYRASLHRCGLSSAAPLSTAQADARARLGAPLQAARSSADQYSAW